MVGHKSFVKEDGEQFKGADLIGLACEIHVPSDSGTLPCSCEQVIQVSRKTNKVVNYNMM